KGLSKASISSPEQHSAQGLKNEIRQPKQEVREQFGASFQRLTNNKEAVINQHEDQGQGDAEGSLPPMRTNPKRNAEQREPDAGKRKRKLTVNLHLYGQGQFVPLLLERFQLNFQFLTLHFFQR